MSYVAHLTLPNILTGIIFDCDGVILNSRAANALYYNKLLEALNLPPQTAKQEAFTHMSTVREALQHIIPAELHAKALDVCKNVLDYKRDIMPHITLEDGFLDFVNWAQEHAFNMAVHTNRFDGMPSIIETFRLDGFFKPIITAADAPPKPAPDGIFQILKQWEKPQNTVIFVGDSANDQRAAMAGEVAFVAYKNLSLDAAVNINSFNNLKELLHKKYVSA